MQKRPLLYLTIETKSREQLGKSFLAARAVERGWIVVMGGKGATRIACSSRGTVVASCGFMQKP